VAISYHLNPCCYPQHELAGAGFMGFPSKFQLRFLPHLSGCLRCSASVGVRFISVPFVFVHLRKLKDRTFREKKTRTAMRSDGPQEQVIGDARLSFFGGNLYGRLV